MPVFKSKSRLNAEQFYQQQQEATNRAIEQGFGGISGYLFGPSQRERADISRATEAEAYALEQQRALEQQGIASQEQARALSDVLVAGGMNPRGIPGIGGALGGSQGAAVATQLMANPAVSRTAADAQEMQRREMDLRARGQELTARGLDLQERGMMQGDMTQDFQQQKFAEGLVTGQQTKFLQQMAGPAQIADATQRITGSLATGNAIGGLAAIIGLAKVLDPTSVVREGEVTTIQGGMGIGQSLMDAWNRAQSQGFSPESAKDLQAVVDANAIPVLQRAIRQKDEFANGLDQVLGDQYPGIGRAVSGSGIDWDWVSQYTGQQPQTGGNQRVMTYQELQGQ